MVPFCRGSVSVLIFEQHKMINELIAKLGQIGYVVDTMLDVGSPPGLQKVCRQRLCGYFHSSSITSSERSLKGVLNTQFITSWHIDSSIPQRISHLAAISFNISKGN